MNKTPTSVGVFFVPFLLKKQLLLCIMSNAYKPKWNLVHFKSLEPMVRALENGAEKYAPHDWQTAYTKEQVKNKMQRHLAAIMDGNEVDEGSGLLHIGHLMADAMFYSYFLTVKKPQPNNECSCTDKPMD